MFSSWPSWREEEGLFWRVQEGGRIARLPPKALGCPKRWKSLSFCEILPLLFCQLDLLTNKHCRASRSIINLWKDPRTCQTYRIPLSEKQSSNNYLELSKEIVLGNMMLRQWPFFTWQFFMIWFFIILKSIFQKLSSCPRDICTQHWRKPPILTAFLEISLYHKSKDSEEHV